MAKRKETKKSPQVEPQIVDELGIPLARPPKPEDIAEDEQWRLINETGILQHLPEAPVEDLTPLADSVRTYSRCRLGESGI
jgi:hypothetical protein